MKNETEKGQMENTLLGTPLSTLTKRMCDVIDGVIGVTAFL